MKIEDKIRKALKKIRKTRSVNCIREISYDKVKKIIRNNSDVVIVDTRSPQEFAENRINFAINIPLYDLDKKAESLLPEKNGIIILYCQYGVRSKKAYQILEAKGYTNLYSLKGGIDSVY